MSIFTVYALGEPKAELLACRVHDNILGVWFNVFPEGVISQVTTGVNAIHVVFGAKNVGSKDGYLWGRLFVDGTNESGLKGAQWCAVGNFVYWEKTFNMPTHDIIVVLQVGH